MWLSVLKLLFVWNSPVLLLLSVPLFPCCRCGAAPLHSTHSSSLTDFSSVLHICLIRESWVVFTLYLIGLVRTRVQFLPPAPVLLGSEIYMNTNVHLHPQHECSFHSNLTNWTLTYKRLFKWAVDPEIKILLSSTHPRLVTNSYDFPLSKEHKRSLVKSLFCSF